MIKRAAMSQVNLKIVGGVILIAGAITVGTLAQADVPQTKPGFDRVISNSATRILNYDGTSDNINPEKRDWPVTIIFYGEDLTVPQVKDELAKVGFSDRGGNRDISLAYQLGPSPRRFSHSKGRKSACEGRNGARNLHIRLYSGVPPFGVEGGAFIGRPSGPKRRFVAATTHYDLNDGPCKTSGFQRFGYSESVENRITDALESQAGLYVRRDFYALENQGSFKGIAPGKRASTPHLWESDGRATAIRVPSASG